MGGSITPIYDNKWADGGGFATVWPGQDEVVVATQAENALSIPNTDVTIYYEGKKYRYADREKFRSAYMKGVKAGEVPPLD